MVVVGVGPFRTATSFLARPLEVSAFSFPFEDPFSLPPPSRGHRPSLADVASGGPTLPGVQASCFRALPPPRLGRPLPFVGFYFFRPGFGSFGFSVAKFLVSTSVVDDLPFFPIRSALDPFFGS